MSTKRTSAPTHSAHDALAMNDSGDVATTDPGPISAANIAANSASVPFANATANFASVASHRAASNASTAGPWVSESPRRTATTAAMSSSSTSWRLYGITELRRRHEVAEHRL